MCGFWNKRAQLLDEPELSWKTLPQSDKGHLLFDLEDSKAFGDPIGPGPLTRTSTQLTLLCRRVERSRLHRLSQRVPMRQTHLLMTKKIESNVLSAEFKPMASFDKYDTLVQANHDQLGSWEETFVLWKQRVELLTTAADQSLGSQKMEERPRERGDKKLIWVSIFWCVFLATRSLPRPDEIMMSPRRTPSSSLDDLRSAQDKQQLMFCRKVFDRQICRCRGMTLGTSCQCLFLEATGVA